MNTGIFILLVVIVVGLIVFFLAIKFDYVEVDPKSPFFKDEIRSEGIDKFKLKRNERIQILDKEGI